MSKAYTQPTIVQFGYPKYGNSLLWTINFIIMKERKSFKSYVSKFNLSQKLDEILFQNYHIVDDVHIFENGELHHSKLQIKFGAPQEPIDLTNLLKDSSIIWCHDAPSTHRIETFDTNSKFVYIMRDVFDVLKSYANHSARMTDFNPGYKVSNPQEVLDNRNIISSWCDAWKRHITTALQHKDKMLIVRYEDIVKNKELSVQALLNYYFPGIDTSSSRQTIISKVVADTDVKRMNQSSPNHIRSKEHHRGNFNSDIKELIESKTETIRSEVGYS